MKYKNFKTDFEAFYKSNEDLRIILYDKFLNLPLAFSFSVYTDFFYSNYIYIQIKQLENNYFRVSLVWNDNDLLKKGIMKNSLDEAKEEGLLVAKEYYSKSIDFEDFENSEFCIY